MRDSKRYEITCSIIGSFRRHYTEVASFIESLEACQVEVLSPRRSRVINPNVRFVRLQTDNPLYEPVEIQLVALHRILRSHFVYTFCPAGYIGRTTCYEIGRIHERGIPLYFSESPQDLPIAVAASSIISPERLAQSLREQGRPPAIITTEILPSVRDLQIRLARGEYVE